MMHRYHYKTRNMVRKALKEGITIRQRPEQDALKWLYTIHTENMAAIGGKHKSWQFFGIDFQVFRGRNSVDHL